MLTNEDKDRMTREVMPLLEYMAKRYAPSFPRDDWRDVYGYALEQLLPLFDKWDANVAPWPSFVNHCIALRIANKIKHDVKVKRRVPNTEIDSIVMLDKQIEVEDDSLSLHEVVANNDNSIDTILDQDEVNWLLSRIPDPDIAMVHVLRQQDYSVRECAEILGLSPKDVWAKLRKNEAYMVDRYKKFSSLGEAK